jgi:serine protein kinase
MSEKKSLLENIKGRYASPEDTMTVQEYLDLCKKDKRAYIGAAERMLEAIGTPTMLDTSKDPILGRIFSNRIIKEYPAFKNFYGMSDTIDRIVSFFKHASQGLEERKQILYLLGPVGGGKSSLAEKLKQLMEKCEIYVIDGSPVWESPLGLFSSSEDKALLEEEYGISSMYVPAVMSPWAAKRLREYDGDISQFKVRKIKPSIKEQTAVSKVEPGDENNQDISTLVGKVDIRKLGDYAQNDPDAYSYSGGLCRANQGIMEFVEMFKAPIKILHPLLTATQEGNFNGTENIGSIPFSGVILAHSNEREWSAFVGDKKNEAFLDRVYIVRVPYALRVDDEIEIYQKLLRQSSLAEAPCAPQTLDMMAQFAVMSRIKHPDNSSVYAKMKVYNGESLKEIDPKAKSIQEYRDDAGIDEGMTGISTRFAFKVLSRVFNYDNEEVAANPVHMVYVLEQEVIKAQFPKEQEDRYINLIKSLLVPKYSEFIADEINKAYIDSYKVYGQNIFDRYVEYCDHWIQDNDYRDFNTGEQFDKETLNKELEKIEKPAGIVNAKDFRNEVLQFVLRARAKKENDGKNPAWDSYEKMKNVIEKKIFTKTEDLLPVISFGAKANKEEEGKHNGFVKRMKERKYTDRQIQLLVEWFLRYRK